MYCRHWKKEGGFFWTDKGKWKMIYLKTSFLALFIWLKKCSQTKEGSRVEDKLGCEAIPVTASSDTLETRAAEMFFRLALTQRPFCSPVTLSLDVGCPREGAWSQLYSGGKQRRRF